MDTKSIAARIVAGIVRDLSDRRGLRHEWEQIDDEIKADIVTKWEDIAAATLAESAWLKAAIRRITVDAPNDQPNGPTEQALLDLEAALDGFPWRDQAVDGARAAAARLCSALADDAKALREAADAYFGEDFTKPAEPA